jgi:hypothetical protein
MMCESLGAFGGVAKAKRSRTRGGEASMAQMSLKGIVGPLLAVLLLLAGASPAAA